MPNDPIQVNRLSSLLPNFHLQNGILYYKNLICVPRRILKELLQLAHDSSISGHFGAGKTLERLSKYHWKGKTRDAKKYCEGCLICQQQKDSREKRFSSPQPLSTPTLRWGSLTTLLSGYRVLVLDLMLRQLGWTVCLDELTLFRQEAQILLKTVLHHYSRKFLRNIDFQKVSSVTETISLPPSFGLRWWNFATYTFECLRAITLRQLDYPTSWIECSKTIFVVTAQWTNVIWTVHFLRPNLCIIQLYLRTGHEPIWSRFLLDTTVSAQSVGNQQILYWNIEWL